MEDSFKFICIWVCTHILSFHLCDQCPFFTRTNETFCTIKNKKKFPVRINGRRDVRWKTKVVHYYTPMYTEPAEQNEISITILTEGRASNPTESINVKLLQSITTALIRCSGCATSTSIALFPLVCGTFYWKWEHYYVSTFWAKRMQCNYWSGGQISGRKYEVNLTVSVVLFCFFTISFLPTQLFFPFPIFFFSRPRLTVVREKDIIPHTGAFNIIPSFRSLIQRLMKITSSSPQY